MAGALVHQMKFASTGALTRNSQSKRSVKRQNSVLVACTLQTPQLRMTGFSGLRGCNALDNVEKSGQTLHSKVATVTSIGRRRGTRIAPKAVFDRFTGKAMKVVVLAQEEARRLGHNFVGTEQLLLGLIGEGTGIASTVLGSMGINLKDARAAVEKIIGRGCGIIAVDIPFTPRARCVLELSGEEAKKLGHNDIDTEHLLLGLLREGEGVAARVLENLGADPTIIRTQVLSLVPWKEAFFEGVRGGSSGKKMLTLAQYVINLTELAEEGILDPVAGRQDQVERVTQILARRTKNNACLIGEPGVRKTAIAEGLAQRIANGDVPKTLLGKKVITLDVGFLVACMTYQREFGETFNLKKLVEQIKQSDDVILFIDDVTIFFDKVHTLIGAGDDEGALYAAGMWLRALYRDELQCIVGTTLDEYKKYIVRYPILESLFEPVKVPEPSVEDIQTLKGVRERNEINHNLPFNDKGLVAAARLSLQCISRFLPVKAIDSIDEVGSRLRPHHPQMPKEAKALEEELSQIIKEKYEAVKGQDFLKAAELKDREKDLKVQISALMEKNKQDSSKAESEFEDGGAWVTESDLQHIVSSSTRIPAEKVSTDESGRLLKIEESLRMLTICVKILFELMDAPLTSRTENWMLQCMELKSFLEKNFPTSNPRSK